MEEKNKKMKGNDIGSKLDRFRLFAGLLQRYFNGEATPKEKQIIDTWDAQSAWEKHREKVNNRKMDAACDEVWDKISSELHLENERKTIRLLPFFYRYAAAAVILILLGGGILLYIQNHTLIQSESTIMAQANILFQTTNAQTRQITLPDGSTVHLNRGTTISYVSNDFNRRQREVWLEGEAFFDVTKNTEKPFIIHTGDMTTTVRGTSFNVKAYNELDEIVVSVQTGKVEINNIEQHLGVLVPNKQLVYSKIAHRSEIRKVDAKNTSGWLDGMLVFENAGIKELSMRLKQNYDVALEYDQLVIGELKLNGIFREGMNLDDVMKNICTLYNLKYSVDNKTARLYR